MSEQKTDREKLRNLSYSGMFAALTALLTALLHIPVTNGYVHCGDAVIYLAAAILPLPYAVGASAVGGMLADLISGYPAYALPTFLIKGLLAAAFSLTGGKKLLCVRRFAGMTLCGIISVLGYWVTAVFLYGGWSAQFTVTVPGNLMQAAASAAVYSAAALALMRSRNRRPDSSAKM